MRVAGQGQDAAKALHRAAPHTEQRAWCRTPRLTEPSSSELKALRSWEPTTRRSQVSEASVSASTGWTHRMSSTRFTLGYFSRQMASRLAVTCSDGTRTHGNDCGNGPDSTWTGRRRAQIVRLYVFHLLQTLSPHTADPDAGVPARGLHGEAYRGHVFRDELFALPWLDLRFPEISRALGAVSLPVLVHGAWVAVDDDNVSHLAGLRHAPREVAAAIDLDPAASTALSGSRRCAAPPACPPPGSRRSRRTLPRRPSRGRLPCRR